MPDVNYSSAVTGNGMSNPSGNVSFITIPPYNASSPSAKTTSGITVVSQGSGGGGAAVDFPFVDVTIFR
jgi:hypothetical protein